MTMKTSANPRPPPKRRKRLSSSTIIEKAL
jgi:hypothetical protein